MLNDQTIYNPPKEYTITLAAGELNRFFYEFDYIRFLAIDKPDNFLMSFGDSGSYTDIIGAGIGIKLPITVRGAAFKNISTSETLTITFMVAIGQVFDDRVIFTDSSTLSVDIASSAITLPTSEVISATLDSKADVSVPAGTSPLILAANSTRKEVVLSNLSTNTVDFRIGDSGVGAANGIPLAPSSSMVLTTTAAIYAYCASTQNICVTEILA